MIYSIKIFKGYDRLPNPNNENHPSTTATTHKPSPRNRLITAAISVTLLLTLTLAALILALVHESTTEPPDSPAESLTAVCSVTPHPTLCFNSINNNNDSSLALTDPELIFALSLKVSFNELKNLASLPQTLISKTNDARSESALGDCGSLFSDAAGQLGDSVKAVEVGPGEKVLDEVKIGDLNAWISAAMTCEETCLDGLEEVGSTVVGEVRERVQRSKEYLSNSLAILANIQTLLHKFHLALH